MATRTGVDGYGARVEEWGLGVGVGAGIEMGMLVVFMLAGVIFVD